MADARDLMTALADLVRRVDAAGLGIDTTRAREAMRRFAASNVQPGEQGLLAILTADAVLLVAQGQCEDRQHICGGSPDRGEHCQTCPVASMEALRDVMGTIHAGN